ncbi:MAG: hypothetical protein ABTQ32_07790 [Myxococcaceae bacterium]
MKVQFVVTGRCEELALHHSVAQLFPTLEFLRPLRLESFTSTPITDPPKSGVLDTAFKFAAKLVEKVDGDDQTLVVGVDDQEAEPNPERQIKLVCDSVRRVLDEPPAMKRRERLTAQVMERCSFHLLIPMVEAYFFGDLAALGRAGARSQSKFDAGSTDVEHFSVLDERFTGPPDTTDKDDWARGGALRHRHPKRYLKFLSGNGSPGDSTYRESKHGAAALQTLNWPLVASNARFVQSARALVADIADWAGVENPLPGVERDLTSRHALLPERVLRNA